MKKFLSLSILFLFFVMGAVAQENKNYVILKSARYGNNLKLASNLIVL